MLDFSLHPRELRGCRSVELRALCNEVPRTPPGPEGSNGTGIASGAADHPKFLSLKTVYGDQLSVFSGKRGMNFAEFFFALFACELKTVYIGKFSAEKIRGDADDFFSTLFAEN